MGLEKSRIHLKKRVIHLFIELLFFTDLLIIFRNHYYAKLLKYFVWLIFCFLIEETLLRCGARARVCVCACVCFCDWY